MPWKPADASRHDKDADSPKKKRQWAHIANASKERGDDDATAIRKASGTVEHEIPSFLAVFNEGASREDHDWIMFLGQLAALARSRKLDLERGNQEAILRPKRKEFPRIVISRGGLNGQVEVSLEEQGKNPSKKRLPFTNDPDTPSTRDREKILKYVRNMVARSGSKFAESEDLPWSRFGQVENVVMDGLNLYEKVQEQLRRGQMVRPRPKKPKVQRVGKRPSLWNRVKKAANAVGSAAQQAFDTPAQYR